MLEKRIPSQNEEWVSYPDGKKVLLDTLKTPYLDSENKLLGILGISRNITAKKAAENALKDSELRFEMLSNHSRVYSWQIDKNGLYTYLSNSVLTVLGFEPEELVGKKHLMTISFFSQNYSSSIQAITNLSNSLSSKYRLLYL